MSALGELRADLHGGKAPEHRGLLLGMPTLVGLQVLEEPALFALVVRWNNTLVQSDACSASFGGASRTPVVVVVVVVQACTCSQAWA